MRENTLRQAETTKAGSAAGESGGKIGGLAGLARTNSIPNPVPAIQGPANPRTAPAESATDARAISMKSFISDYLRANESIGSCLFTRNRGLSFGGPVAKSYISKNKELFFNSWSALSYSAPNDLKVAKLERPDTVRLTFTSDFDMKTGKKTIKGTATNTWDIENADSNPKIIAEKQKLMYKN